jgi:GrpB-like predicted nucleotidyltransferase (UPF0157 family)
VELIGGAEKRDIHIASYDADWPHTYESHRRRIHEVLGAAALRIDHVGSTAVPGLAAKPIVDIQVSVTDPDDETTYVPALQGAGYELRVRSAGHRMLRTPARDVHVHVCGAGSAWERRHLLFRDRLRVDPDDRALYERYKRRLAEQEWDDMNEYADAKTEVIAAILGRAERWASRVGWEVAPGRR